MDYQEYFLESLTSEQQKLEERVRLEKLEEERRIKEKQQKCINWYTSLFDFINEYWVWEELENRDYVIPTYTFETNEGLFKVEILKKQDTVFFELHLSEILNFTESGETIRIYAPCYPNKSFRHDELTEKKFFRLVAEMIRERKFLEQ